jgi:hypothetical protein
MIDYSEITAILTNSKQIPPFHGKNWLQIHNLLFHIVIYVEKRTIPELFLLWRKHDGRKFPAKIIKVSK